MVILCRKQQFRAFPELIGSHAWSPAHQSRPRPHPYQYAEGFFDLGQSDIHIGRTNVSPASADNKQCFLAAFCAIAVDSSTQSLIGESWLRALVWSTSSKMLKAKLPTSRPWAYQKTTCGTLYPGTEGGKGGGTFEL